MTKAIQSPEEEIQYYFEIITLGHSIYTMGHPKFIVSNLKDESISTQRIKPKRVALTKALVSQQERTVSAM